jgi:hypothetical protein
MVEIGRSCIDADYRSGAVITLLWSGLARYMLENKYDYLIGCASVSMADGGHAAASLYNRLKDEHLCPLEYRVFPRTPLPLQALRQDIEADTPPLIKGYLRAGAWICGEPAWDPDFNTADLPVLLPVPGSMPATPNTSWDARTETRQPHPAAVRLLRYTRLAAHLPAWRSRPSAFRSSPRPADPPQAALVGPAAEDPRRPPPAGRALHRIRQPAGRQPRLVAGHLRDQRRLPGGLHLEGRGA